jgi:ABC-type Fe3+-siderophore transport system permease subunit
MTDIAPKARSNQALHDLAAYLTGRPFVVQLVLLALIVAAFAWSLAIGAVHVPMDVIINTLFDLEGDKQTYIVMRSRLPRATLALLTGGGLALSGALIQAVIRNPLASPKIVGINSGAALFACALLVFFPEIPAGYLPLAACLGGISAATVVFLVAQSRPVSATHLALIGIAVGFVAESGVDYLLVTTTTHEMSTPMVWLTGALWGRTWEHVGVVWLPLLSLAAVAIVLAHTLDIFGLGEETAVGLGLNVHKQRLLALLVATLLASIAVSVVGVMGFVGLMAPHIARQLTGGGHKVMLPTAALVGMLLVVLADGVGRAIAPPIEISAGILTAFIGAPFFIYIMSTSVKD